MNLLKLYHKKKEKEINKLKDIEFDKLRDVHNQYRDIVAKLDTKKARVLEIAHEMIERITLFNYN